MLQKNTTRRIGYWLLHLHQRFDADTGEALREEKLTRRQWQILHALQIGLSTVPELDQAFTPFLLADGVQSYQSIVDEFSGRGWVEVSGDTVKLTATGAEAHERAEVLVNAHADESLRGITEAEFLAANAVLQKIAGNLGDE